MSLTPAQDALATKVLKRLDSFDSGSGAVIDREMIYDALKEASDDLIANSARHVLYNLSTTLDVSTEATFEDARVVIPLPLDYRRLMALKLDTWSRPVYNESVEGKDYADLTLDVERRSVDDPRVYSVWSDNTTVAYVSGNTALDCFPGGVSVDNFVYVPETAPETLVVSEARLTEPLLWKGAYFCFHAIDPVVAEMCNQRSESVLRTLGQQRMTLGVRRLAAI